ncbi:MAG: VTT domain-containing protein, partial [Desulfobacterales bacterium]|nr:VTT domain-containing protein [Desulfobacterales bacterium]
MGKSLIAIVVVLLLMSSIFLLLLAPGIRSQLMSCYDLVCDREYVRQFVVDYGWWAPFIFMGLQVGQVLFAPIPGEVTGLLGGYVFGALSGFLMSTVALTAGSMLNFAIGRLLGERFVRRFAGSEMYQKFNRLVQYKGVLVIFLMYLVPGFPKDYLCMILGLTSLPTSVFFVVTTVGRIPGT